jgi:hypothetical protein
MDELVTFALKKCRIVSHGVIEKNGEAGDERRSPDNQAGPGTVFDALNPCRGAAYGRCGFARLI